MKRVFSLTCIFFLASFRCPVGKYWHYHGERCSELVSMPVDPSLIVTCLVGSLCLVCAIIGILIFINKKCINTRKAVTLVWVRALSLLAFPETIVFAYAVIRDCSVLCFPSPVHRRHTLAPYAFENTLRENPVFENDDGVLTQVSTLPYPSSSASSQSQQSEQEHFASIENIHLSIEVHLCCPAQRTKSLTSNLKGTVHSKKLKYIFPLTCIAI